MKEIKDQRDSTEQEENLVQPDPEAVTNRDTRERADKTVALTAEILPNKVNRKPSTKGVDGSTELMSSASVAATNPPPEKKLPPAQPSKEPSPTPLIQIVADRDEHLKVGLASSQYPPSEKKSSNTMHP